MAIIVTLNVTARIFKAYGHKYVMYSMCVLNRARTKVEEITSKLLSPIKIINYFRILLFFKVISTYYFVTKRNNWCAHGVSGLRVVYAL